MQWEYKVIELPAKAKSFINSQPNISSFESQFNEMGRNGWELIECKLPQGAGMLKAMGAAIFKRPK